MVRRLQVVCILLGATFFLLPGETFAFGRRGGWCCSYQYCCSPCYCYQPCCYWPPCCEPCCIFRVSEPVEPIDGPFHPIIRRVRVGEGVIAQFDVPSGIYPYPIDDIRVVQIGGQGQMLYYGWNKHVVHPGLPGGPVRYSIYLCGYQVGDCVIEARLRYSDNSVHKADFHFRIYDIYGS